LNLYFPVAFEHIQREHLCFNFERRVALLSSLFAQRHGRACFGTAN